MADSNYMIHIAQSKFQQLVRQDTRSIRKAKKRMIRKHRPQPHCPSMQDSLMTQTTQARVPVYDLNPLSQDDISEYRKEGKDSRKSTFSVDDQKRHMIDFEAIGEISDTSSPFICMGDDDDFVAAIDELGGELIDVAFNASGLGKKEIADHGDVVRHSDRF